MVHINKHVQPKEKWVNQYDDPENNRKSRRHSGYKVKTKSGFVAKTKHSRQGLKRK